MSQDHHHSAEPSPIKCLLVDDLQENLDALSALLQRPDLEILTARSGMEALELLLAHDVALAFLDVQMPDMDGFELAELIRGTERTRHIPLIFVTAGARDQKRLFKGYDTGAVDFLFKPVEAHVLRNKADVFFQLYRQKQLLAHELRERTETLRLNEMFTAVLGHDLRNPLTAILMSAEYMQARAKDEVMKATAGGILDSARRMSRMIEDLLDLARARLVGGIGVSPVDTDLRPVVDTVVGEHQAANPQAQLQLRVLGDSRGHWDSSRLGQAISNLIGNALRHGSSGAHVEIELDGTDPGFIVFTVRNAGAIPADVLPNLFNPFGGGMRVSGRTGGLGLGLYIVRQIVQAHGGAVEAITEEADHTSFRFRIARIEDRGLERRSGHERRRDDPPAGATTIAYEQRLRDGRS